LANLKANVIGTLAVLGLLTLNGAGTAQAQTKGDGYVQVIKSAVVEFDAGNWAEARVLFEQAHTLRPSARTLRGMGMTSFELKEYVRAEKELNASLVDLRSPLAEAQRHEVLALLLRLERYIGKLIVHTKPPEANPTITLDGSKVEPEHEMKVDLGRHELSVQAGGYRPINRTVSIEGGKTQLLELTLTPLDLDARSAQPLAATEAAPGGGAPEAALGDVYPPPPIVPNPIEDDRDQAKRGVFKQWWFWTIVGVVAAGGVTTAIVLTSKSGTEPPLHGNTGATVQVLSWSR
jgi:hypothetical protein